MGGNTGTISHGLRMSEWMLESIVCNADWFILYQEHIMKPKIASMADPGTHQYHLKGQHFPHF